MYDLFDVPDHGTTSQRREQRAQTVPTINANQKARKKSNKQKVSKGGRCNICYLMVGLLVVLGILIILGLAITAIILATQSLSKAEDVDDLTDECYSIWGVPGEDLSSSMKGHVCFQCGSGVIEAVLDYEFQPGSQVERFDLINTVLGMGSIMNGFEKIPLCGNTSTPLCPAFKTTCTGSCKWSGRLSLTGENKTPIAEDVCKSVRDNPNMYTLFASTDVAGIAIVAQLN